MAIEKEDLINALSVLATMLKYAKLNTHDVAELMISQLKDENLVVGLIPKSPIEDYNIINRLDKLLKEKHCRIIFNHDDFDGYFCQMQLCYTGLKHDVLADLEPETKRQSLLESIVAACIYLESKN